MDTTRKAIASRIPVSFVRTVILAIPVGVEGHVSLGGGDWAEIGERKKRRRTTRHH